MKPLVIGFVADHYLGWMGGAQFLANLLGCIDSVAAGQQVRLEVLIGAAALGPAAEGQPGDALQVATAGLRASGPLQCLLESTRLPRLIFYRDLRRAVAALSIQVIGPTSVNLGADFPVPWFGYITDFQHQYLGHLFSAQERLQRDVMFRNLIENSHGVFVNSGTVVADIERFYPSAARARPVLRLPLSLPRLEPVASLDLVGPAYGMEKPYFLSCSQRWMHKQHPLILRAFAALLAQHPEWPIELVFTGDTGEYRNPDYARQVEELTAALGLAGRARVLGLIPREHQLALIRSALAVVQASLFEGGPGASGTLEAALFGTRIIASDIGPNRELAFGRMRHFPVDSVDALTQRMAEVVADAAAAGASPDEAAANAPFDVPSRQLLEMAGGLQLLGTLRSAAFR
jgi:glycosyltransferase involved in cell wall biosynthesis